MFCIFILFESLIVFSFQQYKDYLWMITQCPALVLPSRIKTPIFCIVAMSRLIVLSASDKTRDISFTEIRGFSVTILHISFCLSESSTGDKLVT